MTGEPLSCSANFNREANMLGKELNVKREGFELVYRAYGMMQAEVVKGRLETSGIPVLLDAESNILPFSIPDMGEVRVFVPADKADEARELLGAEAGDEEAEGTKAD